MFQRVNFPISKGFWNFPSSNVYPLHQTSLHIMQCHAATKSYQSLCCPRGCKLLNRHNWLQGLWWDYDEVLTRFWWDYDICDKSAISACSVQCRHVDVNLNKSGDRPVYSLACLLREDLDVVAMFLKDPGHGMAMFGSCPSLLIILFKTLT